MSVSSNLHVDQLLGTISIKVSPQGFIADKVFPEVAVKKDSDKYRIYGRDFRIPNMRRSNRGESVELDMDVSYSAYYLNWHSGKMFISDRDVENNDIADLRADATQLLTEKILLQREKAVAQLMTTTTFSLYTSLTANVWSSNTTTTDPIVSFNTACASVRMNSGYSPNFAACSRSVFNLLKDHVSILDRIKYTSAEVTEKMIAALAGVGEILVADAPYDSEVEHTAGIGLTITVSEIWGENLLVAYKAQSPGLLKPSVGYTFKKAKPEIKRWRDEARGGEYIEANIEFSSNVVCTLAGYLITNCN